jgi:Leucine-rich repeat (LRR) protein
MKTIDASQLMYMNGSTGDGWRTGDDRSVGFLYSVTVANKGINLDYKKIQDLFMVIDFSSNRFEGKISELLGSLKGLNLLNFSNNALTGYIPLSLGNLTYLESMDLSQNKLLGEISPKLTQLFFLEYFNFSYWTYTTRKSI